MTLNHNYLIMDTQNHALANGEVVSPPGETPIRLNILDNKVDDVTAHEVIILLSSSSEGLPVQGRAASPASGETPSCWRRSPPWTRRSGGTCGCR